MSAAPPVAKKPHLSPSQVSMYTKCGEQYRRRYIEKQIIPPGVALLKGSALHIGAEENYRQKVESHEDLEPAKTVDRAVAAFEDKMNADGILLTQEEEARGKSVVVGEAKDSAARMAMVLATEVMPDIQPVLVEQEQRIVLPDASHDLLGIIDLEDDQEQIRDLKTGAKTKGQAVWDSDFQLSFYALLRKALKGALPKGIVVDEVVDLKKGPKYESFKTVRDMVDIEAGVRRINAVLNGIRAGIFTPATPGAWWCSPRFCGYYATCKYVNAERRAAAETSE